MVASIGVVVIARRDPVGVPLGSVPAVALPGVLLVLGTILFSLAVRAGMLSVVSVLATLFPLVTVTLAVVVLGERLGRTQRVGVGAAIAGTVLVAAG
jgi:uncharacterized membrane protein